MDDAGLGENALDHFASITLHYDQHHRASCCYRLGIAVGQPEHLVEKLKWSFVATIPRSLALMGLERRLRQLPPIKLPDGRGLETLADCLAWIPGGKS